MTDIKPLLHFGAVFSDFNIKVLEYNVQLFFGIFTITI